MENIVKPRIYIVLMLKEPIEERSRSIEYYNGITTEMEMKRDNKTTRHNLTLRYDTIRYIQCMYSQMKLSKEQVFFHF